MSAVWADPASHHPTTHSWPKRVDVSTPTAWSPETTVTAISGTVCAADSTNFPSCNLFVRTEVLKAIGGYRTDFWPGEDTLLCADVVFGQGKRIVYDPWVQVFHHRRPLFGPHLRQIGRYALHRGHFAKRFPNTSLRLSYLLPSLFVAGVIAGAILSVFHPPLRIPYIAVLVTYAALTLLSSLTLHPGLWFVTWLGVMATHLVYGVRFAQGLLTRRMPCEAGAFDHPSEKPSGAT